LGYFFLDFSYESRYYLELKKCILRFLHDTIFISIIKEKMMGFLDCCQAGARCQVPQSANRGKALQALGQATVHVGSAGCVASTMSGNLPGVVVSSITMTVGTGLACVGGHLRPTVVADAAPVIVADSPVVVESQAPQPVVVQDRPVVFNQPTLQSVRAVTSQLIPSVTGGAVMALAPGSSELSLFMKISCVGASVAQLTTNLAGLCSACFGNNKVNPAREQ